MSGMNEHDIRFGHLANKGDKDSIKVENNLRIR